MSFKDAVAAIRVPDLTRQLSSNMKTPMQARTDKIIQQFDFGFGSLTNSGSSGFRLFEVFGMQDFHGLRWREVLLSLVAAPFEPLLASFSTSASVLG